MSSFFVIDPTQPPLWPVAQTPYAAEALAFCQAWVGGQSTFLLHTSGSTGAPKPIELTRAQMRASALLTGQTLGLQAGDAALVCLNIHYVAGVMMLVRGLELGLPMTIIEPSSNPFLALPSAGHSFAFTALVPLQLQTILATSEPKAHAHYLALLNGMKAILVGGAATSPALEQALQLVEAPIYATYGMTETVSHIALRRLNGPDASDLFTALDGVRLGTDERGCLQITAAATNFERIQTNDVVELLQSKQFRLLGRADRIINSGGVKVQPERIEQLIQRTLTGLHPTFLPRLFVAGLPDERLGQRVVLVYEQGDLAEPKAISGSDWQIIQAQVRRQIDPYAVPKELIAIPHFAQTPTGKIDQKATLARLKE